jgi:hypothetical protein
MIILDKIATVGSHCLLKTETLETPHQRTISRHTHFPYKPILAQLKVAKSLIYGIHRSIFREIFPLERVYS